MGDGSSAAHSPVTLASSLRLILSIIEVQPAELRRQNVTDEVHERHLEHNGKTARTAVVSLHKGKKNTEALQKINDQIGWEFKSE